MLEGATHQTILLFSYSIPKCKPTHAQVTIKGKSCLGDYYLFSIDKGRHLNEMFMSISASVFFVILLFQVGRN